MIIRKALLIAFVSGVCGSALADPPADRPVPESVPAIPSDYIISSQDMLSIDVFDVPELGQTALQVDNTGNIAMPFLGQVHAEGLTTTQLSQRIAAQLDQRYVKNPVVTVMVKDAASQKITVDGQVTQPGIYEISPNTTLTQAVALAKGPSNIADTHKVSIMRASNGGRTMISYDLDQIHDGKTADPFVRANDEVVVDVSDSRKFVRDFGQPLSSTLGLLTFWHP